LLPHDLYRATTRQSKARKRASAWRRAREPEIGRRDRCAAEEAKGISVISLAVRE
jgi:hypothetical protein